MGFILLATSLVSFLLYGADKLFAKQHKRRIPEATLLLFTFLGGSLGAALAMVVFRHKIAKKSFLLKIGVVFLLQTCLFFLLNDKVRL